VLCGHIVGYSEEPAGHILLRRSWRIVRLQDNMVVEVVERRNGIAVVGVGGAGGVVVVVEAVVVAAALTGLPPAYSCRLRVRFR